MPDSTTPAAPDDRSPAEDLSRLEAARREKLRQYREELGIDPFGGRVDGRTELAAARALFDEATHLAHEEATRAAKADPTRTVVDARPRVRTSGRVVQHRDLGKLVFLWLRDRSGDLQVSVSRAAVPERVFEIAKRLDYGDLVVAEGRVGRTNKGETCVWSEGDAGLSLATKSLAPPPEKWHGLVDPEIRCRKRYVDLWANPDTLATLELRSRIVREIRRLMEAAGYLEVETPMLQPMAGGAAARPFVTHHNALDMPLFLRIAPELYLKRLLVGGMPKVYEINRNFRNEGIDRSHNPEFTAMEAYEAFGDYGTMLELVEGLVHGLAGMRWRELHAAGAAPEGSADAPVLPFGELRIDYRRPFVRVTFSELFRRACGFGPDDREAVRTLARAKRIPDAERLDHAFLVNALFEELAEPLVDPARPTFVLDWPSAISPLTRPRRDDPSLCERWDLFIAGMEIGPAYTELNDPDLQRAKFTEQLAGADEEEQAFRTLDEDFLEALAVGMPPAGGMGLGIDRLVMLLADRATIRDVIAFPLLKRIDG